jgi:hypothetical protein
VKELSSPVDSMPVLLLWTALKERWKRNQKYCNVLGGSIHDGALLHYESQYTTVNYKQ